MAQGLVKLAVALRDAAAAFDASVVSADDAATVAEVLAITEKACAAARARAALRAAGCGSHVRRGFADAPGWMARATGSTVADARAALATASAVDALPEARAALEAGELSLRQARVIVEAEADCPGSEAELVALAKRSGLGALVDEARRRRLATADPDELQRRQHRNREVRHWRDDLGMVRLAGALPPEVGVPLMNRLDAETERLWRAAGEDREPRAAHAADALVAMLGGESKGGPSADLVLVCDLAAYRRGHTHPDEQSHIVGGGPVPVSVARRVGEDAFVKAVLRDGTRIDTVAHFGRYIPAELRTALELGPDLDGVMCAEEGCGRRYGLEWDHVDPVANGGPTSYVNLAARCGPHHRAKTERDRAAGLLGADDRSPP